MAVPWKKPAPDNCADVMLCFNVCQLQVTGTSSKKGAHKRGDMKVHAKDSHEEVEQRKHSTASKVCVFFCWTWTHFSCLACFGGLFVSFIVCRNDTKMNHQVTQTANQTALYRRYFLVHSASHSMCMSHLHPLFYSVLQRELIVTTRLPKKNRKKQAQA